MKRITAVVVGDKHRVALEAEKRLIAAAPDLLAACETLTPLVERAFDFLLRNSHPEERDGHADGLEAMISEARAAIAKARGEDK